MYPGGRSKNNLVLLGKIGKYTSTLVGFCEYRRSYLLYYAPRNNGNSEPLGLENPSKLQSCFGDKTLVIRVVCPQKGTAVLKGLKPP